MKTYTPKRLDAALREAATALVNAHPDLAAAVDHARERLASIPKQLHTLCVGDRKCAFDRAYQIGRLDEREGFPKGTKR